MLKSERFCDICQVGCSEHYVKIQEHGGTFADYYECGTISANIGLDDCIMCFHLILGKRKYLKYKKETIDIMGEYPAG